MTLLLVAAACAPGDEGAVAPTGEGANRLVVIGIDGATWDVIDPMMAAGELPNFQRLVERGVRARVASFEPLVSPVVWTSFATGHFGRRHDILDFVYPYYGSDRSRVESTVRAEPAIWNLASDLGLSVGVVGYFVTHPVEQVHGFMVSDRAVQKQPASVYPEALSDRVFDQIRALDRREERAAVHSRFILWDYDRRALGDPDDPYHWATKVVADRIERQSVTDEFVRRVAVDLMTSERPDLFISYFRLIDNASHAAWLYYDDTDFEAGPTELDVELLGELIPESYRYTDEIIGELVAAAGEDTNVVVLSDHGFGSKTGPYAGSPDDPETLSGNHRPDAILLAAGPDIGQGEVTGLTIFDITPLLLTLTGLPISEELPGRLEPRLLEAGFLARRPVQTVPRYDTAWAAVGEPGEVDPKIEEQSLEALRALGYVGTGIAAGGGGNPDTRGFWEIDLGLRRRALVGELAFLLVRGKTEEVNSILGEVEAHDPDLTRFLCRGTPNQMRLLQDKLDAEPTRHPESMQQLLRRWLVSAAHNIRGLFGPDTDLRFDPADLDAACQRAGAARSRDAKGTSPQTPR